MIIDLPRKRDLLFYIKTLLVDSYSRYISQSTHKSRSACNLVKFILALLKKTRQRLAKRRLHLSCIKFSDLYIESTLLWYLTTLKYTGHYFALKRKEKTSFWEMKHLYSLNIVVCKTDHTELIVGVNRRSTNIGHIYD